MIAKSFTTSGLSWHYQGVIKIMDESNPITAFSFLQIREIAQR